MVRRYVNLDTDEVKRQHAQASPVDRLVVGPRVSVVLPRELAARLEAIGWWRRIGIADLLREGALHIAERYIHGLPKADDRGAALGELLSAA